MQKTADYIGTVLPCLCAAATPMSSYINQCFSSTFGYTMAKRLDFCRYIVNFAVVKVNPHD